MDGDLKNSDWLKGGFKMTQQHIHQTKQTNSTASGKGQAARVPSRRNSAVHPAALQRALADPSTAAPETILHLQRAIGNRAVGQLLAGVSQPVQAKLTVGPAGDQYEREADRIADQVMSMPAPTASGPAGSPIQRQDNPEEEEVQAKPLAGAITLLIRRDLKDDKELQKASLIQRDEKDEELQEQREDGAAIVGHAGGEAGTGLESSLQSAKGGGQALDGGFRGRMENAFGADFGGVRVHTGGAADQLNRSLQSRAFTTGRDLFFRQGEYNPGTSVGQRLIAHELTHVVQQNGAAVKPADVK
jgi:hypothetical protein